MQGADLGNAQMQGANLSFANMEGADLSSAQMQGVILLSTSVEGVLLGDEMLVYSEGGSTDLFGYGVWTLFKSYVNDWAKIEKMADSILASSKRQEYLDRIKKAQQPNQINQAQQQLLYEPKAIANSVLSAICNVNNAQTSKDRLASAQAFRKSYINIGEGFRKNPDYPKILLDIDYQLCTLDECKDLRDGIEGLDCQKASQNPPKW